MVWRRLFVATTAALALLGVAASVEHYATADHYNPGFLEYPLLTGSHVALGGVYLTLALLQFAPRVRRRWARAHRVLGRVTAAAGLVAGVAALVMAVLFPFSGWVGTAIVWPFGLLFVGALARGVWLARARDFAAHREWMIRAFAVGTSIATMRLIFVPALLLFGEPTLERARVLSPLSFGSAFVIHTILAELWIRRTRGPALALRLDHEGELLRP